jgi:uncharacterized membrane protein/Tfp pilus assembly protein PilN
MALSLVSYWNYGSKYCGIEYNSAPEGDVYISGLTAIRKKEEFEVEKTFQTGSPEECAEKIPKNQHAFLCITGNHVLIKSTGIKEPAIKVVTSAFPNVDLNDFYYEILQTTSGSIVALCRREQVHQIIASFQEHHIRIIGFSLGFFSIQSLLKVIESKAISLSSYNITSDGEKITYFERAEKKQEMASYTLGDTEVNSEFLIPLSAVINYEGTYHSVTNFDNKNLELKKEHHQKVFFNKGMATAVTLLLVMLLINFILFSSYYSELQQMTGKYELEISQKQAYSEKYQDILEKEKIVGNIFNNSNSRSSFYLNRLMVNKPASVVFKNFTYQPLLKKVKEKEPISFEQNVIRILGESKNEGEFSQWIKDLEESSWMREVKVSHFSYSSPGTSDFLLTLKLAEDETVD